MTVPWEAALKGSHLGRLNVLQKGNIKSAGAGCPDVLKDEPAGKMTGLAGLELRKREFMTF